MVKRTLKNAINCVHKKVNKTPIYRFYRKIKTGILLAESFFAADMLRVKLTGLWEISEGGVNNLPFFRLISKRVVVTDCAPQVQLCSVFTKRENIRKISGCATVFFTGEDCDKNHLSYSDYLTDIADLSLGFRLESEFDEATRGKVLRYPLWLLYNSRFYPKGNGKDKIAAFITELEQRKHSPKSEFCALIASHDRITPGVRTALHDAASSVAPVMCAGKFLHNDDRLKRDFKDNKIEYLKRFKFNICPENRSVAGYVTEKIFDSIAAGAIPIYYGGGGVFGRGRPEPVRHPAVRRNKPSGADGANRLSA